MVYVIYKHPHTWLFYMKVKIDTKELFHVIKPMEPALSATMTEEIKTFLIAYLNKNIKNIVLNLSEVSRLERPVAEQLLQIQQQFYEKNASFVTCCLHPDAEAFLSDCKLLELLNVTPTQAEAADMVYMEEIERDLMNNE